MADLKKGAWVRAGITRGRVVSVHDSGAVPDVPETVTATNEKPAARVQVYRKKDGAYIPINEYKGFPVTDLRAIEPLPTPGVMRTLMNLYRTFSKANAEETVNRAVGMWQLRDAVADQLKDDGYYLSDLFADGTETFAIAYEIPERMPGSYEYIAPNRTELYQFPVTNDGADVLIGDPVRVKQEFTPIPETDDMGGVMQRGLMVYRDKAGVRRWAAIVSTATINRQFQIDSKKLYESIIARSESGTKPYLTFYHKGQKLKLGETLAIARQGSVLVAGGTFDEGEFPDAVIRAVETDPAYWGVSMAFKPDAPARVERIGDARIPIYESGEGEEFSILPERDACAPFTNINVERTMTTALESAMAKVFPDDKALQEKWVGIATATDESLERAGAVTRATETPVVAPPATTPPDATSTPVPTPAAEQPIKYELTPEALQAVGAAFMASEQFKAVTEGVQRAVATQEESNKLITAQTEIIRSLVGRVEQLEKSDGTKQRQWLADSPQQRAVIGLPPSMTRAAEPAKPTDKPAPVPVPEVAGHTFNNF